MLIGTSILIAWNKASFFVDTLFVLSALNALWLMMKTRTTRKKGATNKQ
jgi:hypothetical protein